MFLHNELICKISKLYTTISKSNTYSKLLLITVPPLIMISVPCVHLSCASKYDFWLKRFKNNSNITELTNNAINKFGKWLVFDNLWIMKMVYVCSKTLEIFTFSEQLICLTFWNIKCSSNYSIAKMAFTQMMLTVSSHLTFTPHWKTVQWNKM